MHQHGRRMASRPDEVMEYCPGMLPYRSISFVPFKQYVEKSGRLGCKVAFETAANGSTSQLLDSLVIRLADRKNVAVPLTEVQAKEGQSGAGSRC